MATLTQGSAAAREAIARCLACSVASMASWVCTQCSPKDFSLRYTQGHGKLPGLGTSRASRMNDPYLVGQGQSLLTKLGAVILPVALIAKPIRTKED